MDFTPKCRVCGTKHHGPCYVRPVARPTAPEQLDNQLDKNAALDNVSSVPELSNSGTVPVVVGGLKPNAVSVKRSRQKNPERYRAYMRDHMRAKRARERANDAGERK